MIVKAELDASFFRGFTSAIEGFGGLAPAAGVVADFVVDPGIDKEFVADGVSGVESLRKSVGDGFVVDVIRGSGEAGSGDGRANFLWGKMEVIAELDFLVAGGGDFGECAGKIGLQV